MTLTKSRTLTYSIAAAAVATIVAGCGGGSSGGGTQSVAPGSGASGSTFTTHSTSIGTVMADSNGRTVYELVGDPASNSMCTGECLSIWPAVKTGSGAIAVVHGHPAFTFSGDTKAGETKGQNVKDSFGLWLALAPGGKPIGAAAGTSSGTAPSSPPASSSSSSSGGGGYGY
jgi:predicted lipoprotein with Yx(FWY)xxD motif